MRLQYLGQREGGVASLSCIDPYLSSLYLRVEVADERKLNEYILQLESPVVKKKLLAATEYQALSQVDTAKFITDAPLSVAQIKSAASLSDAVNVVATAKNSETSCYGAAGIKTNMRRFARKFGTAKERQQAIADIARLNGTDARAYAVAGATG